MMERVSRGCCGPARSSIDVVSTAEHDRGNERGLQETQRHRFLRQLDHDRVRNPGDSCEHARRAAVDFVHLYAGRDKRRQRVAKLTVGARHVRK